MKLLILSDSHGNLANMVAAVEKERPDMVLHLGDCWRDAQELHYAYPELSLEQVPGNCDFVQGEVQERLMTVEGCRIMFCHGHTRRVKSGYHEAIQAAHEREADLLLFGHTHKAAGGMDGTLTWMNPGSVGDVRKPSYGVVLLGGGEGPRCWHGTVGREPPECL